MRWSILLVPMAVLVAAGVAISQAQPPAAGGQSTGAVEKAGQASNAVSQRAQDLVSGPPTAEAATTPRFPQTAAYGGQEVSGLPGNAYGYLGQYVAFNDPEIGELSRLDQQLEQESRALVKQIAQAEEDANVDGAKEKLREVLEKQFDAQQKIRDIEIARIEERIKKLRDVVNKRNTARRTIVDRRQQQLIDEAEGFGWSSPGTAGSTSTSAAFDPYSAPGMPLPVWQRNGKRQPGPTRTILGRPGAGPPGAAPPATKEAPAATPRE